MIDIHEKFTDNSKYNICVACKDCKYKAKAYSDGSPIPEGEDGYDCSFCEKYTFDKPNNVYFDEADCPYKEVDRGGDAMAVETEKS